MRKGLLELKDAWGRLKELMEKPRGELTFGRVRIRKVPHEERWVRITARAGQFDVALYG